ncbi:capsid protein [Blackfly genomovirus 4]|uniref:Capsid protein n=1 Tax=Blackfly genomovirus 4 TaxID=2586203 RepID=A0A4Y5QKW5_9VIRU|nr:capsid protein [Blackfly genomovirus 4]QCX35064.1 capsid protein [Blackfly genomovirus 4]
MAYYRSYKQLTSYQRRKHGMRGAKPSNRRPKRRYSRKRRSRPRMSKRSILDMTSRKKRDTMAYYSNSTAGSQSGGSTYTQSPAIITGGQTVPAAFLWCATYRDNTFNTGGATGGVDDQATRTAQNCYMRGLKENIEIQVADNVPWQWRRICFTAKGLGAVLQTTTGFAIGIEASTGFQRVLNQLSPAVTRTALETLLFKGALGQDWLDPMTAPTDNSRLTIKYDKTITIASGNEGGAIRKYNRWHGMNKTLVYNDDEAGGDEQTTYLSTVGKAGMGDYYVLDYFKARIGSTTSNQLSFAPNATLYWHEK